MDKLFILGFDDGSTSCSLYLLVLLDVVAVLQLVMEEKSIEMVW